MNLQKKKVVIFLCLAVTQLLVVPLECPWKCKCTNYKTWCHSATLNGIPSSPSNRTEFLEIRNDNITKLSRDAFQDKGLGSLTKLILVETNITHIEDTAFQDLIHLTDLNITNNAIRVILPGTFRNLSKLTSLVLSNNKLGKLPSRAFEGLSKIRILSLSQNTIPNLNADIFYGMLETNISHLHELQISELNLRSNYIRNVTPGTFQNMSRFTHLYLKHNSIRVLMKDSFLGLSGLRELELSDNPINYIEDGAFKGLSTLTILRLVDTKLQIWRANIFNDLVHLNKLYSDNSNALKDMGNNTFSSLTSLIDLSLQNIRIPIIRRETFQNMTYLRKLGLPYNGFEFIEGNSFRDLHNLSHLNLGYNKLSTLTASTFRGLKNLKILIIIYNNILNIEAETFKEQSILIRLHLSYNKLTNLIKNQFYGLISLKDLSLHSNKISHIDVTAFYHLKALRVLNLEYNNISFIHNGTFSHLYRLNELFLKDNKMLTLKLDTFAGISELKKLSLHIQARNKNDVLEKVFKQVLYIRNFEILLLFEEKDLRADVSNKWLKFRLPCKITALESDFLEKITGFNNVSFRHCKINTIYSGAFKPLHNVTNLILGDNNLTHLEPDIFEDLVSLEGLSVSNNNLSVLHPNTFTRNLKLQSLYLDGNKMLTLPLSPLNITSLQFLSFRGCSISYITPLTFSGVPKLLSLDLAENNLMTNTTEFGSSNNLRELDLSWNKLTQLNKNVFQEIKSLEVLVIGFNQISVVEEDTFVGNKLLRVLELTGNPMLIFYPNFLSYPSIQELYLKNCNITSFPTLSNLIRANLTTLDLTRNNLTEVDLEFIKSLRNLKHLNLNINPIPCDCKLRPLIQDFKSGKYKSVDLDCEGRGYYQDLGNYFDSLECNIMQHQNETERQENIELQYIMQYVESVILGIMFLIGVLGNVMLIFIFLLHSEVRTFANAPILNLAIADLLSLVFNLALSFTDNLSRSWKLGLTLCKLFTAVRDLIVGASVYSVVSLSLQRYNATIQFNRQGGLFGLSDRVIIIMLIVGVWTMAFCFAIPAFISATVETRCLYVSSEYGEEYIRRTWVLQLFFYCIFPATIIVYFYIKTAGQLKESVRNYPGEIKGTPQTQRRLRSANIVIVLTAMFCISYGPNFLLRVLTAWSVLDVRSDTMTYISFVTYCLFFFNTCFNPIALYNISSVFKHLFRRYLLFWRCCQGNAVCSVSVNSRDPAIPLQVLGPSNK